MFLNLPNLTSTVLPTLGTILTHYLSFKCGELSMKVVWRAGMAMVWWLSCNQLWSESKLGLKRRKERGSSKYLVEIVDASEICCMISAPSQEILKKVILGDDKCITLFCVVMCKGLSTLQGSGVRVRRVRVRVRTSWLSTNPWGVFQGFFRSFISLISKYKLSLNNVESEKISSKEASLPLQHLVLFRIHWIPHILLIIY